MLLSLNHCSNANLHLPCPAKRLVVLAAMESRASAFFICARRISIFVRALLAEICR